MEQVLKLYTKKYQFTTRPVNFHFYVEDPSNPEYVVPVLGIPKLRALYLGVEALYNTSQLSGLGSYSYTMGNYMRYALAERKDPDLHIPYEIHDSYSAEYCISVRHSSQGENTQIVEFNDVEIVFIVSDSTYMGLAIRNKANPDILYTNASVISKKSIEIIQNLDKYNGRWLSIDFRDRFRETYIYIDGSEILWLEGGSVTIQPVENLLQIFELDSSAELVEVDFNPNLTTSSFNLLKGVVSLIDFINNNPKYTHYIVTDPNKVTGKSPIESIGLKDHMNLLTFTPLLGKMHELDTFVASVGEGLLLTSIKSIQGYVSLFATLCTIVKSEGMFSTIFLTAHQSSLLKVSLERFKLLKIKYEKDTIDCITNSLQTLYPDKWDLQKLSEVNYRVLIHFPEFVINNENDDDHIIRDLYIGFEIHDFKSISYLTGTRSTYTQSEIDSDYAHSHLPGVSKGLLNFCMGSSDISAVLMEIRSEPTYISQKMDLFEYFLLQIEPFIEWESLEGSPHRYITDIVNGSRSYISYLSDGFSPNRACYEVHRSTIHNLNPNSERFLKYLEVTVSHTHFQYESIRFGISDEFLLAVTESVDNHNYLVARDWEGYYKPENSNNLDWDGAKLQIQFKGQPIIINIVDNEDDENDTENSRIWPDPELVTGFLYKYAQHFWSKYFEKGSRESSESECSTESELAHTS